MSSQLLRVHSPSDILGPGGEQAWERLRQHLEWSKGPWIVFVFSGSILQTEVLRTRTESWLRERNRSWLALLPETATSLRGGLGSLLSDSTSGSGCVWVEAIRGDAPDPPPEKSWRLAWEELLLRANEKRDVLREHLGGGLVFALSRFLKPMVAAAAPDLWSVRSFVLDIAPVPLAGLEADPVERLSFGTTAERIEGGSSVKLALSELERLASTGMASVTAQLKVLDRAIRPLKHLEYAAQIDDEVVAQQARLLQDLEALNDRVSGVCELLSHAPDTPSEYQGEIESVKMRHDKMLAQAMMLNAQTLWLLGRVAEAEQRLRRAMEYGDRTTDAAFRTSARVYLAALMNENSNFEGAEAIAREAIELNATQSNDLESKNMLTEALLLLGEILGRTERADEAITVLSEVVALERAAATAARPNDTCQPTTKGLRQLGELYLSLGRLDDAEKVYRQAIDIQRRLVEANSDAVKPRRDLTYALSGLRRALDGQQRFDEAETALLEVVSERRRCAAVSHARFAPGLASSLSSLGVHYAHQERYPEAFEALSEAMSLLDDIVEPQPFFETALLATSYLATRTLAHVVCHLGKGSEVEGMWRRALPKSRRRVALLPGQLEPVSDLMSNLVSLAKSLGDSDEARCEAKALLEEAIQLGEGLSPAELESAEGLKSTLDQARAELDRLRAE